MRPLKNDPAPSRWAWRLERLMLTPGFRFALRVGLPFTLTFALASWQLSRPEVQDYVQTAIADVRTGIEQRPEFMVNLMAIDGVDDKLAQTIRETLPVDLPASSFDLDLEALRLQLVEMDPVKSVAIRIRAGGVLHLDVAPRIPVVIWRTPEGLFLLDDEGETVKRISYRTERPDLPVVAGERADGSVSEALKLFEAAGPLGERVRGLVRMGERRWDVVLDRGQRILLPEEGAMFALERVIALDAVNEVLARDVARIDMRLKARPTIKMQARATEERWRIREMNQKSE